MLSSLLLAVVVAGSPAKAKAGAADWLIDLQDGFDGTAVVIEANGEQAWKGNPRSNHLTGLSESVKVKAKGDAPLKLVIRFGEVTKTLELDPKKGRHLGVNVAKGQLETRQQDKPFGYD
jgi:hypothetical protein